MKIQNPQHLKHDYWMPRIQDRVTRHGESVIGAILWLRDHHRQFGNYLRGREHSVASRFYTWRRCQPPEEKKK